MLCKETYNYVLYLILIIVILVWYNYAVLQVINMALYLICKKLDVCIIFHAVD